MSIVAMTLPYQWRRGADRAGGGSSPRWVYARRGEAQSRLQPDDRERQVLRHAGHLRAPVAPLTVKTPVTTSEPSSAPAGRRV
jgi:hypothetical protein